MMSATWLSCEAWSDILLFDKSFVTQQKVTALFALVKSNPWKSLTAVLQLFSHDSAFTPSRKSTSIFLLMMRRAPQP